ncbi:hypothetical protein CspeluHIS016_0802050 [Cutaneotrichosporon spelunceum]|uniref:BTB domain-containing protein n=1 Tax=Cutaneotrichosporon spelunceum TaxID=1672016 RepID=A0AAD3TZU9_9TREE|nr:hypothetical protein CspeluHIS016_0802050 [Cutaneotrichosporon spelunceum]
MFRNRSDRVPFPDQVRANSPWPATLDYGDSRDDSPLIPRTSRSLPVRTHPSAATGLRRSHLTTSLPSASRQHDLLDDTPVVAEPSPATVSAVGPHFESNDMPVDVAANSANSNTQAASNLPLSPHLLVSSPRCEQVSDRPKPIDDMGVDLMNPTLSPRPPMAEIKSAQSRTNPIVVADSSDPDRSEEIPLSTLRGRLSNPPNPGPVWVTNVPPDAPPSTSVPVVPGGRRWWVATSTTGATSGAPSPPSQVLCDPTQTTAESAQEHMATNSEPEPETDELDVSPLPTPAQKLSSRFRKNLTVIVTPQQQQEQQPHQTPQATPLTALPPYVQHIIAARTPRKVTFEVPPVPQESSTPGSSSIPERPVAFVLPTRKRGQQLPKSSVPQIADPQNDVPKTTARKTAATKSTPPKPTITKDVAKSAIAMAPKGPGKDRETGPVESEAAPIRPRTPPPPSLRIQEEDEQWSPRELKQIDRQAAARVVEMRAAAVSSLVSQYYDVEMETEQAGEHARGPEAEIILAANKYQPNNTLFGTGSNWVTAVAERLLLEFNNFTPRPGSHDASSNDGHRMPCDRALQRQQPPQYPEGFERVDHPMHCGHPEHPEKAQHSKQNRQSQLCDCQRGQAQHPHQDAHEVPGNRPYISNVHLDDSLTPGLETGPVLPGSDDRPLTKLPPNISYDDEYAVGDFIVITSDDVLFRLDGTDLAHASRELYASRTHTPSKERFLALRRPHENAAMFRAFLALLLHSDLPLKGEEHIVADTIRDLFDFLEGWGSNKAKIAAMILHDKVPRMTLRVALSVGGMVRDDKVMEATLHRWARVTVSMAGPGEDVCKPGVPGNAAVTDPKNWDYARYEAMPRDYVYALTSAWTCATAKRYGSNELPEMLVRNFRVALQDARSTSGTRKRADDGRVGGEKKIRGE